MHSFCTKKLNFIIIFMTDNSKYFIKCATILLIIMFIFHAHGLITVPFLVLEFERLDMD